MLDNPRKRKSSLLSPPLSKSSRQIDTLVAQSEHRVEARGPQPETQDSLTSKCIDPELRKKRRRTAGAFVFSEAEKRNAECQSGQFQRKSRQDSNCRTQRVSEQDPIEFWARTGQWLKGFSQMSGSEIDGANKRRRSSTPSYSSRARDGSVAPAYTAAYEEELRRYGIMFNDLTTKDSVTTQSKEMCQALLDVHDLTPAYNSCSEETYIRLFQRASKCGEERIRRDLTPHIVPSAELLYVVDRDAALQNVREELSGDWTRCGLLGGTQLRPDYAYGLSSATFSEEERSKLENYTSINNPTKFTDSMYFPFLLCEAKCGKKNINDADRQNVHSASIAVNAIIQLCRVTGEFHAQRLSGQILVFSISHDNERVKIYGHFPLIRDGCITFHRYYVHDYSLDGHGGRDRNTGTNFTRAVYRTFYPQHLRRIQEAVARLPDPRHSSMISEASVGEGETQASEQSSQERDITSRPPLRRAKSRGSQGELTLMKQQMSKMEQMYKDQINQQQKQMEKQKDDSRRQMEQQKEDSRRQME